MKRLITITALIIAFLPSLAFSSNPTLTEANALFAQAVDSEDGTATQSLLNKALLRYEQVYRDHPSGRLAYNIGNTYYQMGNKPMALVFYKRAQATTPTDPNLLHNMELVREELQLPDSQPQVMLPWLPPFFHTYRLHLFLTLYGLFWMTASIRYVRQRIMPLAIPISLLFLCLAGSTIVGMELLQPASQEGVITATETIGHQGNGRNFEPSFKDPLAPGTEFQILEKRGYWLRIQLRQGDCWIPARSCEVV